MKSILRRLYNGEINPYESISVTSKEYNEVNGKIQAEKGYFKQHMSEDDFERLIGLENLYTDASGMETEKAFGEGFGLGLLLMVEVMAEIE